MNTSAPQYEQLTLRVFGSTGTEIAAPQFSHRTDVARISLASLAQHGLPEALRRLSTRSACHGSDAVENEDSKSCRAGANSPQEIVGCRPMLLKMSVFLEVSDVA
jgi:hypothetical protein